MKFSTGMSQSVVGSIKRERRRGVMREIGKRAVFDALASALTLALLTPAGAVTVKEYETQRDSTDQAQFRMMRIYLTGVVSGFIWGNSELAGAKKPVLFCQPLPPKNSEDTVKLIDDEIGQPYVTRDLPVELLLLNALIRKYPCA